MILSDTKVQEKQMTESKITIEASVTASIEKVWAYWTRPEHITKWNFASPEWCCPSAENDLRIGGTYTARMEARDGSMGFDFQAIYDEVVEPKKLVYTMSDGRQLVTTFQSSGDITTVTTIFEAETQNPIEMQKKGWQAIIDNFKNYTENN